MDARITVSLLRAEKAALMQLAANERRDPRQQAALLIRQSLECLGLLPPAPAANIQDPESDYAIQNYSR